MGTGKNIRRTRELKEMTRESLSNESGITLVTLGRYEREERTPNLEAVNKLALALKVELDVLLYWTENLVTLNDIYRFTNNLFPNKYYEEGYDYTYLSKFLDIVNFHSLFTDSTDIADYMKFSRYFTLSEKQTYNWILSVAIQRYLVLNCFIEYDLANDIVDKLVKEDKLVEQEIVVGKKGFSDQIIISDENIEIIDEALEHELPDNKPNRSKENKNILKIDISGLSAESVEEIKSFVEFIKLKIKKQED